MNPTNRPNLKLLAAPSPVTFTAVGAPLTIQLSAAVKVELAGTWRLRVEPDAETLPTLFVDRMVAVLPEATTIEWTAPPTATLRSD